MPKIRRLIAYSTFCSPYISQVTGAYFSWPTASQVRPSYIAELKLLIRLVVAVGFAYGIRRLTGSLPRLIGTLRQQRQALDMGSMTPQQISHQTMQFLNSVLSQRGPNALPYEEDLKFMIRQQVGVVIQEFPGLQVKPAQFTHNDGRAVTLLQCEGTIPMMYQGVKYNIPVTAWLLEGFPRAAPLLYVNPTRDMLIKPRHAFVDASGLVNIPYLREWLYPRSSLVDLVQTCSVMFGQEPPLFSRPRDMPSPPGTAAATGRGPQQQHAYGGYSHGQGQGQGQQGQEDPGETFRKNAVTALAERAERDLATFGKEVSRELDAHFQTQALLQRRGDEAERGVRALRAEKEALERQLQDHLASIDALQAWLRDNDKGRGRKSEGPRGEEEGDASAAAGHEVAEVDVDRAFEPQDAWSRQMLECTAADLAIEDIMYSLDKAVQEDDNGGRRSGVGVDAYLRHTRSLAREQFYHRATALKVRAAQMQAHVASMARRSSSSSGSAYSAVLSSS
eukprot:jgi/Mesen1/10960/ME000096S10543